MCWKEIKSHNIYDYIDAIVLTKTSNWKWTRAIALSQKIKKNLCQNGNEMWKNIFDINGTHTNAWKNSGAVIILYEKRIAINYCIWKKSPIHFLFKWFSFNFGQSLHKMLISSNRSIFNVIHSLFAVNYIWAEFFFVCAQCVHYALYLHLSHFIFEFLVYKVKKIPMV